VSIAGNQQDVDNKMYYKAIPPPLIHAAVVAMMFQNRHSVNPEWHQSLQKLNHLASPLNDY
jgi:hypothetical protein